MNRADKNITLAMLSAIVIGIVNLGTMCLVYVVFNGIHTALGAGSTNMEQTPVTSSNNRGSKGGSGTGSGGGGVAGTTGGQSVPSSNSTPLQANGSNSGTTATGENPSSNGSPAGNPVASSGSSGASHATGGTPTPAPTPASLVKGSPCQTQTPPAGVCASVLSFNSQKIGNPNWDPNVMASIEQGVANNAIVKTFGLNANDIFNSMQITLEENTWSGNATHGTIGGKMGAIGQSQPTTFTLDWNGSRWIVDGVVQG